MKWNSRPRPAVPCEGDTRIVKKYMLLPRCLDGEWRWLERCWVMQEYKFMDVGDGIAPVGFYTWRDIGFDDGMHPITTTPITANNIHKLYRTSPDTIGGSFVKDEVITATMMNDVFRKNTAITPDKPIKCAYCGRPLSDCGCGAMIAE